MKISLVAGFLLALAPLFLAAQTPLDEDSPWPRVRSTNGNTVTMQLPQVERWTSNSFVARAVVGVKPASAKEDSLGVIWFEAHGAVDRSNRVVTLDRMEITKGRFPETTDNGSNALAVVREVFPSGARTVSLDYLITALGFAQAAARQGKQGLNHTPPEIIWATNRTVLVLINGEPILSPIAGKLVERVVNTPALLIRDKASAKFYLAGDGQWFTADSIGGPWSLAQSPPASVAELSPKADAAPARAGEPARRIIVRTKPAELLMTSGLPDYRPIRGTALQYAVDTDNQLFFDTQSREFYVLLSGRWFKATSLRGPWSYVPPGELPADFAKIPPGSPQALVLASVPGTLQAELALVANSAPTTATVDRQKATLKFEYDGQPKFQSIDGTELNYALNAPLPVIRAGEKYYALEKGVWFVAASPTGPWQVASEVPEEVYTIPPSSPVYYATFARVYDADSDKVEVGYTPGYTGAYEHDGTIVYGTGWNYEPWHGNTYYGWGWTWGYSYVYVPWYQWWVWRPWWNEQGGLRAATVDNIYSHWQPSSGIAPSGGAAGSDFFSSPWQGFTSPWPGYSSSWEGFSGTSSSPSTYGRYQGTTRPEPMAPPPSTLALNPYSRPKGPAGATELPHGAQLLSTVRKSPGGGRDLYASADGNIYQRRNDGWYRRQAGGNWSFFAPTQGQIQRGQSGTAAGGQRASAGGQYRATPGASVPATTAQARRDRVPNVGTDAHAREVAALERQYYARALGQMRAQNIRRANVSMPARGGVRRR